MGGGGGGQGRVRVGLRLRLLCLCPGIAHQQRAGKRALRRTWHWPPPVPGTWHCQGLLTDGMLRVTLSQSLVHPCRPSRCPTSSCPASCVTSSLSSGMVGRGFGLQGRQVQVGALERRAAAAAGGRRRRRRRRRPGARRLGPWGARQPAEERSSRQSSTAFKSAAVEGAQAASRSLCHSAHLPPGETRSTGTQAGRRGQPRGGVDAQLCRPRLLWRRRGGDQGRRAAKGAGQWRLAPSALPGFERRRQQAPDSQGLLLPNLAENRHHIKFLLCGHSSSHPETLGSRRATATGETGPGGAAASRWARRLRDRLRERSCYSAPLPHTIADTPALLHIHMHSFNLSRTARPLQVGANCTSAHPPRLVRRGVAPPLAGRALRGIRAGN